MLIVIVTAYVLCAIGYAITGFLFLKRSHSNPYIMSDDSLTIKEDSVWSADY